MGDKPTVLTEKMKEKMNVGNRECKGLEFMKAKCKWVERKWVGKNVDGRKEWMGEKQRMGEKQIGLEKKWLGWKKLGHGKREDERLREGRKRKLSWKDVNDIDNLIKGLYVIESGDGEENQRGRKEKKVKFRENITFDSTKSKNTISKTQSNTI